MASYYKPYPGYKDSGIAWLGEIPSNWQVKRLKHLGEAIIGLTYSPNDIVADQNEGTLVLRSSNIQSGKLSYKDNVYVNKPIPEKLRTKAGDILICARNGSRALIGKNALIDERSSGLSFGAFMSILRSPYNDYLSKVLNSSLFDYQSGTFLTATINQLTTGNLGSFEIPFPSEDERGGIANFLDHETAKIDTLIEEQKTLIRLLQEKRQAVISHAVTKGLNPDVPLKDSGVEWLGQVPEHWELTRFKFLCDNIIAGPFGSSITKDMYKPTGYKVYGQEQVIPNDFEIGDYFISEKDFSELSRYEVRAGEVLISCVGTFGKIAVFPDDAKPGIINPRLIKATLKKGHNPHFVREFLKSTTVYKQFELLSRGGTMGVINIAILNEILAAVPPKKEQELIAQFISEKKCKFRMLIEEAQQTVQLLQERRTALISAAVTGKIDVREWVAPTQKQQKQPEAAPCN